jgi:DNA-binding transcriptional MerR regulator
MKIGELARRGDTTTKTIRFYEQAGLLPAPTRTPAGYRDYRPEVVDRLFFVHRAQAAGLSLREVRQVLAIADRGEAPCEHVRELLGARLEQVRAKIAELQTLETNLSALLEHAQNSGPVQDHDSSVCWILESDPPAAADTARLAVPNMLANAATTDRGTHRDVDSQSAG